MPTAPPSIEDKAFFVAKALLEQHACQKLLGNVGGLAEKNGQKIHKVLEQQKPLEVLDLCAGPGNFANHLSLSPVAIRVTGIDLRPHFVEAANQRFKEQGWHFVQGDTVTHDFERKFDVVAASSAYHHIEHDRKAAFLRNAERHLKGDGILLMCENFLPHYQDKKGREEAIHAYYAELKDYYAQPQNATKQGRLSIEEVERLELAGVEEHKVCWSTFEEHLASTNLSLRIDIPVWQPTAFKASNAGSHVLVLTHKI